LLRAEKIRLFVGMTASPRCCRCDVVSDQILHEEWRRREPISPMSQKDAAIPFLHAMRYRAVRGNDAIARAALISRRVDMCDAAPQQPAIRGGRLAAAVRTHMNPKGERVDIMCIIGE
jgi:hypothetical protein